MARRLLLIATTAALLAGCATPQRTSSPPEAARTTTGPVPLRVGQGTELIYRGVLANPVSGQVDWSTKSFGISGGTLSFTNAHDASRACWLEIKVDAAAVPVPIGGSGTIALVVPQTAPPSPWTVTYDNNPQGHWSILKAQMGSSNSTAEANAAAAFRNTAVAATGVVTVINGSLNNCTM